MQNITDFLNESIKINEDKISDKAATKISKFLKKETLDMSRSGFGGFGKDSTTMFVEFYRSVVFHGFSDMNYPELITTNKSIGRDKIKKIDSKHRKYMDSRLLSDELVHRISNKVTSICKRDITTFSKALYSFFEDEGIRGMYISDGIDE